MRQLLALKWRLLPLVIAAAVLSIPIISGVLSRYRVSLAAQSAQSQLDKPSRPAKLAGAPQRIIIPALSIDLPVAAQSYSATAKTWPVAAGVANYAAETALINNSQGESLIYGHNNRQVFGPLLDIEPGAIVYVYTASGNIFKYSYTGSEDVTPNKLSVIEDMAKAPAGLKLITCDGPNFEYRRLMSFKLLQAS